METQNWMTAVYVMEMETLVLDKIIQIGIVMEMVY
jgi:hypothetical protein